MNKVSTWGTSQLYYDPVKLLEAWSLFMLGKWMADARARGCNEKEKDLFEFNARTQITTWSFKDSNLHDYAHREWSGLLTDFYKPRWEMFFDHLTRKMNGENPKDFEKTLVDWGNDRACRLPLFLKLI